MPSPAFVTLGNTRTAAALPPMALAAGTLAYSAFSAFAPSLFNVAALFFAMSAAIAAGPNAMAPMTSAAQARRRDRN